MNITPIDAAKKPQLDAVSDIIKLTKELIDLGLDPDLIVDMVKCYTDITVSIHATNEVVVTQA